MSFKPDSNKNSTEDESDPCTDIPFNQPDDTIEDLLGLTDTEESSSSSNTQVYVRNDQFILELHELTRDELPDNPLPEVKTRKLMKKKKRLQQPTNQEGTSNPSSSPSESSITPPGPEETHGKEEFYDAHESYHALPENQASAALASAGIAQVLSEHGNVPKVMAPAQEPAAGTQGPAAVDQPAANQEPPTTITKPVTRPD